MALRRSAKGPEPQTDHQTNSPIILCADDFAISSGVSEAILSLAAAGRLSATSAVVTSTHWPAHAKSVMRLRDKLAIGLHLNLTLGKPLGAMPNLAPDALLPEPNRLFRLAMAGRINRVEVAAEVERQLDRFESETGFPPDFIDAHHHAHVLSDIRQALLTVVDRRFPARDILIRDPSDKPARIIRRRIAAVKALSVACLTLGFRKLVTNHGFPVNSGFSGYSTFGGVPYEREFDSFLRSPGELHMVMCHPGFAEKGTHWDKIAQRRPQEYAVLSARTDIPERIWRPNRTIDAIGCRWNSRMNMQE
jgi:predicted glycoside hydrolase/deacetylase ChbG (UPF0249 family)